MRVFVSSLVLLATLSSPALAQCRLMATAGKCVTVERTSPPPLEAGSPLPEDARMVMNPTYYGLPRVDGDFRYYVIDRQIYRVSNATLEVIDRYGYADRRLW